MNPQHLFGVLGTPIDGFSWTLVNPTNYQLETIRRAENEGLVDAIDLTVDSGDASDSLPTVYRRDRTIAVYLI